MFVCVPFGPGGKRNWDSGKKRKEGREGVGGGGRIGPDHDARDFHFPERNHEALNSQEERQFKLQHALKRAKPNVTQLRFSIGHKKHHR